MTQIDKALATLAAIVLIICITNIGLEYIKLNQLKESTRAVMLLKGSQTRYYLK